MRTGKIIYGCVLIVSSSVCLMVKLYFLFCHHYANYEEIKLTQDVLGLRTHDESVGGSTKGPMIDLSIITGLMLDVALVIGSFVYLLRNFKPKQNEVGEVNAMNGYVTCVQWKFYSFLLQLVLLSGVVVLNISTVNLPMAVLFALLISFWVMEWNKKIINIMILMTSASLIVIHYVGNIPHMKNKINVFIGIGDLKSTNINIYFFLLLVSYLDSIVSWRLELNQEKYKAQLQLANEAIPEVVPNRMMKIFYSYSPFCFKILSFLFMYMHVCGILFLNYIILLLGMNRSNKVFTKIYLLPSFFISLCYYISFYIFNTNMSIGNFNGEQQKIFDILGLVRSQSPLSTIAMNTFLMITLFIFTKGSVESSKQDDAPIDVQDSPVIKWLIDKSMLVCLIVLLISSSIKPDLIHLGYFLVFILLFIFVNDSYLKFAWDILLTLNKYVILLGFYFWNIAAVKIFNIDVNTETIKLIGLSFPKEERFIYIYSEHILLFIFGYLHNFYYQKYSKGIEEVYSFPEQTRYITFICVLLSAVFYSLIRPYSFLGALLLTCGVLLFISCLFLINRRISIVLSKFCLVVSICGLILKFLFRIDDVMLYVKARIFNNNDPSVLQSFELDSENSHIKILFLVLSMFFLRVFEKYEKPVTYEEIAPEYNPSEENMTKFDKGLIYAKVLCYQIIFLHGTKIFLFTSALVCVYLESLIGATLFMLILVSMFIQLETKWKTIYILISIISPLVITTTYIINILALPTSNMKWIGFDPKTTHSVFYDILPYFLLLSFAFLSKLSKSFRLFFKEHTEINPQVENQGVEGEAITSLSRYWFNLHFNWHLYGFYFVLVGLIVVSFIKVNLLSLILMAFVGCQSFGTYNRSEFKQSSDTQPNVMKRIYTVWYYFALFLSLVSLYQFCNFIWFPPTWEVTKPWEKYEFFCSVEGQIIFSPNEKFKHLSDFQHCVYEWKAWLSLDNYEIKDIFFNFICILLLLVTREEFNGDDPFKRNELKFEIVYSEESEVLESEQQIKLPTYSDNTKLEFDKSSDLKSPCESSMKVPEHLFNQKSSEEGDDLNFTKDLSSFRNATKYFLFFYLKYIILVYIILISIIYSHRYTSMIYCGFLSISFYLLCNDSILTKSKSKMWSIVQYYNYIILVAFMLFQTPFLACPVNMDGRVYLPLEECVEEETRLYQSFLLYNYPKSKLDALYMMMVQTIGLMKLNFELLIVSNLSLFLIYIVALVQCVIFAHPFQIFVDAYHQAEKLINRRGRAFTVVQDTVLEREHLMRSIYNINEILLGKLERLEKRTDSYARIWQQTNFSSNGEDVALGEFEEKNKVEMMIEEIFLVKERLTGETYYNLIKNDLFVKEIVMSSNIERRHELKKILKDIIMEINVMDLGEMYRLNRNGLGFAYTEFENHKMKEILSCIKSHERLEIFLLFKLFNKRMIKYEERKFPKQMSGNKIDRLDILPNFTENKNVTSDAQNEDIDIQIRVKVTHNSQPSKKSIRLDGKDSSFFRDLITKHIDKTLLIDLTQNPSTPKNQTKRRHLIILIGYFLYSNIFSVLFVVFLIHQCSEASLLSAVYPISYFCYALVEYPFPSKSYWKGITKYSLIVITFKLLYQLPFFCGYPSLALFNLFGEDYCVYYPLTGQEIQEGIDYIIGLRKYNGEYSYPKNSGLLSGIIGDVIILCLLIMVKSYLKRKGIWNFVDIDEDLENTPRLMYDKQARAGTIVKTVKNFFKRLVPEFFVNQFSVVYKPGYDYYSMSFVSLLLIAFYVLLFFGNMTGKNGSNITDVLEKQQFSKDLVWMMILLISLMVFDRVVYKMRSIKSDYILNKFKEKENAIHLEKQKNEYRKKFEAEIEKKGDVPVEAHASKHDNSKIFLKNIKDIFEQSSEEGSKLKTDSIECNENNHLLTNSDPISQISKEESEDIHHSNIALGLKIFLHYTLIFGGHYVLFISIPLSTHLSFFNNPSLIFLYLLFCLYLYFNSLQIKQGYPLITRGQYFTESATTTNYVSFSVFRNVPFLVELRAILDWTITRTSLDLFQWMKIEDAYANLFRLKFIMKWRSERGLGLERPWYEKLFSGYCFFGILVFIIIFPMILFSSFNPNLVENKVLGGKFRVNVEMRARNDTLFSVNLFENTLKINSFDEQWRDNEDYSNSTFLPSLNATDEKFEYLKNNLISNMDDIDKAKIQSGKIVNYTNQNWNLSPPSLRALTKSLNKTTECYIKIEWDFIRELPYNNKNIHGVKEIKLSPQQINALSKMLETDRIGNQTLTVEIKDAFPKIVRLMSKKFQFVKFDPKHKTPFKENTDISLQLIKDNDKDIYWSVSQVGEFDYPNSLFFNKHKELTFLIINEDVISSFLGFNTDGSIPLSIIGIYATLVYTVGKFIRIFFDKLSQRVIYEEMPEPDPLLELCEGVYIYRNQRNLVKENILYDLLVRIYRSPETLIKITGAQVKRD